MILYDSRTKNKDIVYVEVIASFNLDGKITPHKIRLETGEVFAIDKVKDCMDDFQHEGGRCRRTICRDDQWTRDTSVPNDISWSAWLHPLVCEGEEIEKDPLLANRQ